MNDLTFRMPVGAIVAEYESKAARLEDELRSFEDAGSKLRMASTVYGTYGQKSIDTGRTYLSDLQGSLLKSAWLTLWEHRDFNISAVASAKDKKDFQWSLDQGTLPDFTIDNIRATFGDYIADPRGNILRGLAEVFSSLDPFYKSHEKVKIGVKGMPKRVIIGSCGDYAYGYGFDKVKDVINALAAYQGLPAVTYDDMRRLWAGETDAPEPDTSSEPVSIPLSKRGVSLRRFKNGNAHLFFSPAALRDINLALAEFYGEVLPDCAEATSTPFASASQLSADLQYYPTPPAVVRAALAETYIKEGMLVLEPSCGCGRFMDAIRELGAEVHGVEYAPARVAECRAKGHSVHQGNFLAVAPRAIYDRVVMNPPFSGKHYHKHVRHAMKFLKEGGELVAVLPATARYDHGLLAASGDWRDLPVGSFRDSGTNVNTVIYSVRKRG